MLMFRKSCVVILVVLLLASLTIGSIDPIGSSVSLANDSTAGTLYEKDPVMMFHDWNRVDDHNNTFVTLDMRDSQITQDDLYMFMLNHKHEMIRNSDNGFIRGNMTLHTPGQQDRSYQVEWVKASQAGLIDGLVMASFVADMRIPMPPPEADFQGPAGLLTFHSMINISSPILSQPTTMAVQDNGYNSQISQGETVWHQQEITGRSTTLNVSLKWQTANDSLRLMIYTPDGHVLGPYYDSYDGKLNNEINLTVSNPDGITSGSWSFKVTGTNVTSQEGYYLRAW